MKKLSIAYFGSPDFSADFLEKILLDGNLPVVVRLVVTQPDSPVGRKRVLTPTPIKQIANKYKIQTTEVGKWKTGMEAGISTDLALVYAFGELIPEELLNLPKYGFWNVHPSLLPKYRGPSPIASPLINGDVITGVTIIKMDREIDHGPIIVQKEYKILPADKRPDLEKKLTDLGFEMFKKLINKLKIKNYELKTQAQNHNLTTLTKKLSKNDGFIEFEKLKTIFHKPTLNFSLSIFNLFRGLYPWPGLWTVLPSGKRLKITDLELVNGKLIIKRIQLEGKKAVDFGTFEKAYKLDL